MRVAIIGAGFTGLTAAYELSKAGHQVVVFEKESFAGGLASGMKQAVDDYPFNWEWDLERFYHHWFTNDDVILSLVSELGCKDKLITKRPLTASWYQGQAWQLDSALSLLQFSPLSLFSRLRMGWVLAYLKYAVGLKQAKKLEKVTANTWLRQKMGDEGYETVWEPLLRGKFADYYQNVNMAWFWARVHKRTPSLMYFDGGFRKLIELLVGEIIKKGGEVKLGACVQGISWVDTKETPRSKIKINGAVFDRLIVTTPPPILAKLASDLPQDYKAKLTSVVGIGVLCLILVLDQPLLDKIYWLNINESNWPFVAVVEHTNSIDPVHYGGKHIVYIGNYLPTNHPQMRMSKEELIAKFKPFLQRINPQFNNLTIEQSWLFKEPFAQPIVELNHSQKILPLETPMPGVYLASMNQIYPWDRGTNYAIEMGKRVAREIRYQIL